MVLLLLPTLLSQPLAVLWLHWKAEQMLLRLPQLLPKLPPPSTPLPCRPTFSSPQQSCSSHSREQKGKAFRPSLWVAAIASVAVPLLLPPLPVQLIREVFLPPPKGLLPLPVEKSAPLPPPFAASLG